MSRPAAPRRRVVVTGLGVKCPAGTDVDSVWRQLLAGASSIGPIARFDERLAELGTAPAGPVRRRLADALMPFAPSPAPGGP